MKKITLNLLVAAVAVLCLFSGCDKYHRDRYTGTWEFTTEMVYFNISDDFSETYIIKRDTVFYIGKISLTDCDFALNIQYTEWDKTNISIDKEGVIYHASAVMWGRDATAGQFESRNKMLLNIYWGHCIPFEGVSKYRTEYIRGTKKGRR